MRDFAHLHLHTQYSLLDGAADIKKIIALAKENGMKSVAITDHGVMYGVVEFYCTALENGIRPIIGCEVYTAPRKRTDKDKSLDSHYGHLVLLCENNIGYSNLLKLVTLSNTEGFYYKPRVDKELLQKYHEGLIALSGCIRGDVPYALLTEGYTSAFNKTKEYIDIFGKDNFFLEIQNHGLPEEETVRRGFSKIAKELSIGLVATNDVHYAQKSDSLTQDVLTCIQTGRLLADTDRMKMKEEEYYFRNTDEMYALFKDEISAVENTVKIADRCSVSIDMNTMHLPSIDIDSNLSHEKFLYNLCISGLKKKYETITDEIMKRLEYELGVINSMGYTNYFLIVYDFIKYSKENNIAVGPGRGSAAGSIVSYALDITEIDPLEYNLLFERFLNPERVSMPDIDVDFCFERRDEVRDYVANKYGRDRVSQIITFGTMAAKAAIRDVGRVLGADNFLVNKIANAVPGILHIKLIDAIKKSPEMKKQYQTNRDAKRLLDIAMAIEGFPRHASTHAAGVVIADAPLFEYAPLQECDTGMQTQYPMAALEKIGLLKMDFLGLRNLTVIRDSEKSVEKIYGEKLDINKIPLDDKKTFALIARGDTDGVFQLENPGLQTFLKKFKPKKLEDIVTTTSIYRPGPMEQIPKFLENVNHPDKITYKHPLLKEILEPTYGVVIYQEQVMKIVRSLAGYSMGRADLVRRTMAKKKSEAMKNERQIFINGLEENGKVIIDGTKRRGIDDKTANEIFDSLIDFANYAFNKSHAACYALVAYRTAYLKAHYPVCYLASVLKSYAGNISKAAKYISSFKKYGINVLPPDINKSGSHFTPEGKNIRTGLCWIKNMGIKFPEQIEEERTENGNFKSFEDFIDRMCRYNINKRSIESLIKCGAFDSVYDNRRVLLFNSESLIDSGIKTAGAAGRGQVSWFGTDDSEAQSAIPLKYEETEDFTREEKLSLEMELSGMYFSGHPLDKYRMKAEAFSECSVADTLYRADLDGKRVALCGRISDMSVRLARNGKNIASMTFSDFSGFCKLIAFEPVYTRFKNIIYDGAVISLSANVSYKEETEETELIMSGCTLLDKLSVGNDKSLYLRLAEKADYEKIEDTLREFSGKNNLCIYFENTKQLVKSDLSHGVNISDELYGILCKKFGYENVKIK